MCSLQDRYIIATEGWNLANRTTESGALQPAPSFTNSTVRALADQLHSKGKSIGNGPCRNEGMPQREGVCGITPDARTVAPVSY